MEEEKQLLLQNISANISELRTEICGVRQEVGDVRDKLGEKIDDVAKSMNEFHHASQVNYNTTMLDNNSNSFRIGEIERKDIARINSAKWLLGVIITIILTISGFFVKSQFPTSSLNIPSISQTIHLSKVDAAPYIYHVGGKNELK